MQISDLVNSFASVFLIHLNFTTWVVNVLLDWPEQSVQAELKAPPCKCFVLLFHLLASVRVRTDGSHELFAARDSELNRQIPFKGGGRQTVVTLFLSGLYSSDVVDIYITSNKQSSQICYTLNWFSCNFGFECLCVCISEWYLHSPIILLGPSHSGKPPCPGPSAS